MKILISKICPMKIPKIFYIEYYMKTINIKNSSLKNILRKKVLLKKCISTFDIQNIYIIKFCIIKAETKIVLLNKIYVSNVILQIW